MRVDCASIAQQIGRCQASVAGEMRWPGLAPKGSGKDPFRPQQADTQLCPGHEGAAPRPTRIDRRTRVFGLWGGGESPTGQVSSGHRVGGDVETGTKRHGR